MPMSTNTRVPTRKTAASQHAAKYSASSARRTKLLPVGSKYGLAIRSRGFSPLGDHGVAYFLQVSFELRRRRRDIHAVLLERFEGRPVAVFRCFPAAFFRFRRHLDHGILRRLVQLRERFFVDDYHVLRQPHLRIG